MKAELAILGAILLPMGCAREVATPSPEVVFSIPVLALITQPLLPEGTDFEVLLPRGASPHGYEPPPSRVVMLDRALLLVLAHPHMDGWASAFAPQTTAYVWPENDALPDATAPSSEQGDLADPHAANVHFWTDPVLVRRALPHIADILCRTYEGDCDRIRVRADSFGVRLDSVAAQIGRDLAPLQRMSVLTSHPFLDHFLVRFGVNVLGSIRPVPGQDPRPSSLAQLMESARDGSSLGILVEKSTDNSAIAVLADDVSMPMVEVDPLGHDMDSYEEYLRHITDSLLTFLPTTR